MDMPQLRNGAVARRQMPEGGGRGGWPLPAGNDYAKAGGKAGYGPVTAGAKNRTAQTWKSPGTVLVPGLVALSGETRT